MNTYMEKHTETDYEAKLNELLKDKERIVAAIKGSPFLKQKNEDAARQLSQLKPPFPWQKAPQQKDS